MGANDARVVHLPTQALHPTGTWEDGSLVREEFEITIPDHVPEGEYTVAVGWYDTSSAYASFTDHRSRMGQEIAVFSLEIPKTEE